jgi:hypothetical protein
LAHFPEFKEVAKFLKNLHIIRFLTGFLLRSNEKEKYRTVKVSRFTRIGNKALITLTFKELEDYSPRRLFTGFALAALTAWEPTVINAMNPETRPAAANIHQLMAVL